ncbi:MAG: carbonic anhydrase family protein [Salinimicrobium sediminis]|nr:carbonic anhydrase family protein [Salinimicrobium sediminis]
MKKLNLLTYIFLTALLFTSCGETGESNEPVEETQDTEVTINNNEQEQPVDRVLTAEERNALTPDDVVAEFHEGNTRYIKDSLTLRDRQTRIAQTGEAQNPKGMVLSCIDSRVPVEEIFDQGLGDLFVGRIAGNFADTEMLGSMEYATKVAGSKVLVVLGHKNCGAVKSAIEGVELGNITALLDHIEPAIAITDGFPEDQRSIKNEDYVNAVIKNNVRHTIEEMREKSPIIAELENNGDIKILGAFYDVSNGTVEFL